MKDYPLNPIMTNDIVCAGRKADKPVVQATTPLPRPPAPEPGRTWVKLGLDVHLAFTMAVVQRGHGCPSSPRKYTRQELVEQVGKWTAEGLIVCSVQESCGFGFVLHRELEAAGAHSYLITPIALNGKRKTDKLDARALCLRLSRWLDGNWDELSPIRVASEEEQRKRLAGRQRDFLGGQLRRLSNRAHGLVAEFCHGELPPNWWGARTWPKISRAMDPWLAEELEELRKLILGVHSRLKKLDQELVERVAAEPKPKALGNRTLATLDGEMCNWNRFNNRKQVGSYTGCCPGEHTSGGKRRVGSIDRMGNGRVRAILVEAVWRFLRWQPGWKAAKRQLEKLKSGTAMKKKTVIALARQLAIDLWRWRTGRCTMEQLGWVPAA